MVIDVFSKYGWIRGLKDKKTETVRLAFADILRDRKPKIELSCITPKMKKNLVLLSDGIKQSRQRSGKCSR